MYRRSIGALLALALTLQASSATATTWTKVRYNGGPLQTRIDPKDWNNQLTVTPDSILVALNDGQRVVIAPRQVTALTYGQEARRHVALMTSLGILVAPLALFGLLHKQRLHFIGIEYVAADSARGGVLLQGASENYRQILFGLKAATGHPIQTNAEDSRYVNP